VGNLEQQKVAQLQLTDGELWHSGGGIWGWRVDVNGKEDGPYILATYEKTCPCCGCDLYMVCHYASWEDDTPIDMLEGVDSDEVADFVGAIVNQATRD